MVKLVLGVDAVAVPLTGIGRYAWELARYYAAHREAIGSVCFYAGGRWFDDPAHLLDEASPRRRRRKLFRAPAMLRRWNEQRRMAGSLFHSPNYFLPQSVERGIVTIHDLSVFKYPETHPSERIRQFESGFASTLKRAVHLITDSEAIRAEVAAYFGWPSDRITAVPLGVPDGFRPRAAGELAQPLSELGLQPGAYGLCVSTLEPRKGIDRLIAAYRALPHALRARYPLVLAGSKGWLNDELMTDIECAARQGWLRYVGFVPEASLPMLYAGARAFFMPSFYEGFGLPVLEALASGVPTLTSDRSSLPEVAGGAAWLVAPDDHSALLQGVEHVLCDETWRAAAVERGIAVAAGMTWERCARGTLAVCRRFA
ncbi:glycosyl transferase, group 1 family protein, putative [Burkholderia singularis]|uniref:Glycosyl transferase, group 1 family protein, putative n=1 Tax=Burkholderia singularis TaxID=1503053 RepID=A0A238H7U7_9BURK|nr:glycosyl transferase, group 1 family protein, putative [Burkholderia singularis]